jgi:hypothetical protein
MAKRSRGTTTRPGQRRAMQRPAARPAAPAQRVAAPRPTTLTAEEEARAAELEAAIVAQEQAAETVRRGRTQRASTDAPARFSSLAVAASNEYAYVARDVRRIATVGGTLVGVLAALWVIVQVTHITL